MKMWPSIVECLVDRRAVRAMGMAIRKSLLVILKDRYDENPFCIRASGLWL